MLIILIESLLISMSKLHDSCGILSKSESLFLDQIDLIPSHKKCLGNLDECQQGILTSKSPIFNSKKISVVQFFC